MMRATRAGMNACWHCDAGRLIAEFDHALRTVAGVARGSRPRPDEALPIPELDASERPHAAALMRVNHAGEVCAGAHGENAHCTIEPPGFWTILFEQRSAR